MLTFYEQFFSILKLCFHYCSSRGVVGSEVSGSDAWVHCIEWIHRIRVRRVQFRRDAEKQEVAIGYAGLVDLGAVHAIFQDTEEFEERGFVLDRFRPVWEHSAHASNAGWGVVRHSGVDGPTVAATCFILVAWVYLSFVKET